MGHLLDKVPPSFPGPPALSTPFPEALNFQQNFPLPPTPPAVGFAAADPPGSPRPRRGLTAGEQSQGHGDDRDDDGDPQDPQQPLQEGLQGEVGPVRRQPLPRRAGVRGRPPALSPPNPPAWRGGAAGAARSGAAQRGGAAGRSGAGPGLARPRPLPRAQEPGGGSAMRSCRCPRGLPLRAAPGGSWSLAGSEQRRAPGVRARSRIPCRLCSFARWGLSCGFSFGSNAWSAVAQLYLKEEGALTLRGFL